MLNELHNNGLCVNIVRFLRLNIFESYAFLSSSSCENNNELRNKNTESLKYTRNKYNAIHGKLNLTVAIPMTNLVVKVTSINMA